MPNISVVGLFCEDIRQESAGSDTIIGILPDNLHVTQAGILPRLALYIRIHLDPATDPGPIKSRVVSPNGEVVTESEIDPNLVRATREKALSQGSPLAGLISRLTWSNFPARESGRVRALITAGGKEFVCAHLNIHVPEASPATASEQQPSQSPDAAQAKGS